MADSLPLVFLHGWGFDHRVWDEVMPALREQTEVIALDLPGFSVESKPSPDIKTVAAELLAQMPPRCVLLGWSLGGMVATYLAIHHPERIVALLTVGSNLKWVSDVSFENNEWPGASPDNFAAFFETLVGDFSTTKQHFCSVISRGDEKEKSLVKILRANLSAAPQENFLAGLRLLDSIDNRAGYRQLKMPGLHLFGEKDAMVPREVELRLHQLNSKQKTRVMTGVAHAPFLSEIEAFVDIVKRFMEDLPYQIDKKNIAQSFSKAATTYDSAAYVQREIGDQLFSRLPNLTPPVILDLGCGTGAFSNRLQKIFPVAQVVSLDIAMGMLQRARLSLPQAHVICGDAEQLPIAGYSIDLVYSNLAIQWCQDYPQLFAEVHRVLKPGGVALLSTLTAGTLIELQQAWQAVDSKIHVNRFAYADNLKEAAAQAEFYSIEIQCQTLVKHYASVKQLTEELKAIGARNLNVGRSSGLTGRRTGKLLLQTYEKLRCNGQLPVHYEVLYLVLRK